MNDATLHLTFFFFFFPREIIQGNVSGMERITQVNSRIIIILFYVIPSFLYGSSHYQFLIISHYIKQEKKSRLIGTWNLFNCFGKKPDPPAVLSSMGSLGNKTKHRNPDGDEEEMLHASLGSLTLLFKDFLGEKKAIFGTTQQFRL